jgi:hypothetical protein
LRGKIISLKEFLPGRVDRSGILVVILIELIDIARIGIGYIAVLVHDLFKKLPNV